MNWQPIETAPRGGSQILVAVEQAAVWLVRNARWDDGEIWAEAGYESWEQAAGWWSFDDCVSQRKLEGDFAPTHWAPLELPE